MGFIATLKKGQHYASIWPKHAVVAAMTEATVVPATAFAAKVMPAAAVLNLLVQWQLQSAQLQPLAWGASLFLLSLPLQGWYWLGKRSQTKLPPHLAHWYRELAAKLELRPRPEGTYLDLIKMVRRALEQLPPDQH
ncbi:terminus macrodomain insulation protein YfbV [Pseudidiomarina taiwanensis]|uniref:UPF0208 membrane protein YfbV n=1 Tax=Pseudidiomarina taiwanensis TaxID=337250 RepID=A0A432ZMV0_9GAMM|nr:terminus macrodomain insulation protein YfbV [Pseudidiomarina taiwanensis]RUO79198.1 DUF412 domain-containing protein [Pseudidiomarina taiwanensis]